ncbi:MAG: FkbM family methyltransferase [Lacipirellulaceae bacterium]
MIADGLSEGWYNHDWDQLPEVELLTTSRLTGEGTVFDLGAHQGVVAMMLAAEIAPRGTVVAVEGMKHNCDVAGENLALNAITNVHVRHAVVADAPGHVRFFDGLNGSVARSGVGRLVEAVTVDQLAEQYGHPAVVFLDVEGFEAKALAGATRTLLRPCDWFIEVHVGCGLEEYGGSWRSVVERFPDESYKRFAWKLDSGDRPRPFVADAELVGSRFGFVALHRHPIGDSLGASMPDTSIAP